MNQKIEQAEALLREAYEEAIAKNDKVHDRNRGQVTSAIHKSLSKLGDCSCYYSQHGQDRFIDNALNAKSHGVYVDIGGYDGVDGSNTLFFEQFRHWKGLLIEACVPNVNAARRVRRCPCLNIGLAGEEGIAEFLEITGGFLQMSGFLDSYDEATLKYVRSDPRHKEIVHKLPKRTLDSVLTEHGLREIDYISLDIEGGEIAILETFPFDKYQIDYWSIENLTQTDSVFKIMSANQYQLVEYLGHDEVYQRTTIK